MILHRIFIRYGNRMRCLPGSPAALSPQEDLGQKLCVPSFRVVCLFQAFALYYIILATIKNLTISWPMLTLSIIGRN